MVSYYIFMKKLKEKLMSNDETISNTVNVTSSLYYAFESILFAGSSTNKEQLWDHISRRFRIHSMEYILKYDIIPAFRVYVRYDVIPKKSDEMTSDWDWDCVVKL